MIHKVVKREEVTAINREDGKEYTLRLYVTEQELEDGRFLYSCQANGYKDPHFERVPVEQRPAHPTIVKDMMANIKRGIEIQPAATIKDIANNRHGFLGYNHLVEKGEF